MSVLFAHVTVQKLRLYKVDQDFRNLIVVQLCVNTVFMRDFSPLYSADAITWQCYYSVFILIW